MRFSLMLLMTILALKARAQRPEEKAEKIQAAKVAYITSKLNLTTAQAQTFWPVYNEFEGGKKKIRFQMKGLQKESKQGQLNDEQIKANVRKRLALRQEELDLEKQYVEKFLKVISASQVADLYDSEKEFTKLLLNRWKGEGGKGKGKGEYPDD
jgi:hypothetical protein